MADGLNPTDVLKTMIAEAADEMARLAGGTAVCTFTKAGTAVPGIKYAEGRWASLRELERAVAKGTTHEEATIKGAKSWQEQLTAMQERGANKDWTAYYHGGVDALSEFADVLAGKELDGNESGPDEVLNIGINLTPNIQI